MNMPRLPLAATLLLFAGCGTESPPPVESTPVERVSEGGLSLNGTAVVPAAGPLRTDSCQGDALTGGSPISSYGHCHNGPLLSGTLASVSLSGVTLASGQALDGSASLTGTAFSGTASGVATQAADFSGARFTGTTLGGGAVPIRIDSALQGTGTNADVWEYGFSSQDASGNWHPVCASGATAVPVLGRWDYSQGTATGGDKIDDPSVFTVGCIGSAVAKCVYLGYKPWKAVGGVSLANHHQACTRAVRADYCGNGASYTTTGRIIDAYDQIGVQSDAADGWIAEGEWNPGGARCTNLLNRNILAGLLCNPLRTLGCGHFTSGTLILTETPLDLLGGILGSAGVGGAGGTAATQPQ
ncbi:MAG TPA: ADYC domain-containing protein [Myxococcaceae bacterium]|jgi:hypothetical protein